jgi:hypothetical protein
MATQADVRRIALSLPATEEAPNHFAFSVRNKGKLKGFVWVWMERVTPKQARVPQPKVIAVPAVLVCLPYVTARELRPIIAEAWRCQAPKELDTKEKTPCRRG